MHSQIWEPSQKKPGYSTIRTEPGSRVNKQQLDGTLGQSCGSLIGNLSDIVTIGLESPLLSIGSPFTYVAKT